MMNNKKQVWGLYSRSCQKVINAILLVKLSQLFETKKAKNISTAYSWNSNGKQKMLLFSFLRETWNSQQTFWTPISINGTILN